LSLRKTGEKSNLVDEIVVNIVLQFLDNGLKQFMKQFHFVRYKPESKQPKVNAVVQHRLKILNVTRANKFS